MYKIYDMNMRVSVVVVVPRVMDGLQTLQCTMYNAHRGVHEKNRTNTVSKLYVLLLLLISYTTTYNYSITTLTTTTRYDKYVHYIA